MYIADLDGNRVLHVSPDGIIRTIFGTGESGSSGDGGPATQGRITGPGSLAVDSRDFLYVGPGDDHRHIRRIDLNSGIISSLAGTEAKWIAVDALGNVFFSSYTQVKRFDVATGTITVTAGSGNYGFRGDGGPAIQASLTSVSGMSLDGSGNLYIADRENNRIRRVQPGGIIETVAGGGSYLQQSAVSAAKAIITDSQGVAFDRHGNLFFSDFDHNLIRRLGTDGVVTIVAGNGMFNYSGDGGHPLQASLGTAPAAFSFDPRGNLLFYVHNSPSAVRLITPGSDGVINGSADERIITVAGQVGSDKQSDHGQADGGPATKAVFAAVRHLAVDSRGNLYVADWLDNRIRKIVTGADGVLNGAPDEIITTVADTGVAASTGDGGPATQASVNEPGGGSIAIDWKDNLYITDSGRIRRVDATTGIITTFERGAAAGGAAWIRFDANDNFYFGTRAQLFRIDGQTGERTLVAGTGEFGFSGDGGDARQATFQGVQYLTLDQAGNIAFPDNGNFRIRKITFAQLGVTDCTFALSSNSQSFTSARGSGTVDVAAKNGCLWTAASVVSLK
jgi:sugar lactone lactonase YvrE